MCFICSFSSHRNDTHTQTHQHVYACKSIIMNTVPFSNESVHRETKIPGKICLYSLFIRICIPIYPILSWPTNISTNSKYNFKIYSFYASLLHFRQPALEKSFTLSSRVCALLIHIDVRSPFTWNWLVYFHCVLQGLWLALERGWISG